MKKILSTKIKKTVRVREHTFIKNKFNANCSYFLNVHILHLQHLSNVQNIIHHILTPFNGLTDTFIIDAIHFIEIKTRSH